MSTDFQQYSLDNQKDAIRRFADAGGYEVVSTYEDAGKSGLNIERRAGLQRLLNDVESGRADFEVVLVYDVSRWGRFQNIDESASYEFRCRVKGVRIEYCAEQFINDGSIGSDVLKTLKRSMAAEHSRILSVKVFAGQCRLIGLGFRQGGPPGYGLRRMLIDKDRVPKGALSTREYKNLQTDRVILVPGPPKEVRVVRSIFDAFVSGRSEEDIASDLNGRKVATWYGRPWTRGAVHQMLINEKYIGNNVWNRRSHKLKKHYVRNDPSMWVRANGAFKGIVSPEHFDVARTIIQARSARFTNEEMLDALRTLLARVGKLSGLIIDEAADCPSSSAYGLRFGTLLRAYQLIGYSLRRDYRYVEVNQSLRTLHAAVMRDTIKQLTSHGATVVDESAGLVRINGEFSVSLTVVRCRATEGGWLRWHVRFDRSLSPDIAVAVRMNPDNTTVRDFLIVPIDEIEGTSLLTGESNGVVLDAFLFDSLRPLFSMAEHVPLKAVA